MQKKSETLRQRESAQKELIKLKKMQQGQLDTASLKKTEKTELKTFGEKFGHFMNYHKYKVIVGVVGVLVLAFILYSTLSVPKYDAKVTVYCYEYVSPEELKGIEEWIKEYYPDVNSNGKVEILATDCSFSLETDQKSYVDNMMLKIQSILSSDSQAMLFILDEKSLEFLNGVSSDKVLFTKQNIVELPESFYDALPEDRHTLLEGKPRYLCLRTVGGTTVETEKGKQNYKYAKEVIEALK